MQNFPVRPRVGLGSQLTWLNGCEMFKDSTPSHMTSRFVTGFRRNFDGYTNQYFPGDRYHSRYIRSNPADMQVMYVPVHRVVCPFATPNKTVQPRKPSERTKTPKEIARNRARMTTYNRKKELLLALPFANTSDHDFGNIISTTNGEFTFIISKVEKLQAENSKLVSENVKNIQDIKDRDNKISELSTKIDFLTKDNNVLSHENERLKDTVSHISSENSLLSSQIQELSKKLEITKGIIQELNCKYHDLNSQKNNSGDLDVDNEQHLTTNDLKRKLQQTKDELKSEIIAKEKFEEDLRKVNGNIAHLSEKNNIYAQMLDIIIPSWVKCRCRSEEESIKFFSELASKIPAFAEAFTVIKNNFQHSLC